MRNQYKDPGKRFRETAANVFCVGVWQFGDWTQQRLVKIGNDDFGCLWAPDIIYDKANGDYVLHWSSSHRSNNFGWKGIYYSRTKDFEHFTEPKLLYRKEDSGVIDSAIYEEDDMYYMFVKSERNPANIILLRSESVTGPMFKWKSSMKAWKF